MSALPLLTRGLGATPRLITTGFGPEIVIAAAARVLRKGGVRAKKIVESTIDTYVIAAMLISVNNIEILYPKSRSVSGNIDRDQTLIVNVKDFMSRGIKKPIYRIVISALRVFKGGRNADN